MKQPSRSSPRDQERMKVTFDHFPRSTRHCAAGLIAIGAMVVGYFAHPLGSVPFFAAMGFCLLIRNSIVFDLETRTYLARHLLSSYSGTFVELKGIVIDRGETPVSTGHGQVRTISHYEPYCTVTLVWNDPSGMPYPLASMSELDEAFEYARHASDEFGLPLIEGPGLKKYRAEVERAHRDLLKL